MDELWNQFPQDQWDAGFEGGRYVVVARLWPFVWAFQRPPGFRRRFWHSVHELSVHDWKIPLRTLRLGQLCAIESHLDIRYQPTLDYAKDNLDFLPEIDVHLEKSLGSLIKDIAEQEIARMEAETAWLKDGCGEIEKSVASIVNELLVMRGVHCRTLCHIEPRFAPVDAVDLDALPPWARQQAVYEEYLRRRREARERILREQTEDAANSRRLLLERESTLLNLSKQEEEQREARRRHELESLQAELLKQETRLAEKLESETRMHEEKLRHEARLRQMQTEADLKEKEAVLKKQRAELAAEATRQAEKRESETRLQDEQIQHQAHLRKAQADAEAEAKRKEFERQIESEVRQREDQIRHEARLLQLREEAELRSKEMELKKLRAEMAKVEAQLELQRQCEARQREEQLRHEARLRELQTEQELKEKEIRGPAITELESYLNREIELLATERQRLMLEEEIRDVKLSRSRGLIVNALSRLELGREKPPTDAESEEPRRQQT